MSDPTPSDWHKNLNDTKAAHRAAQNRLIAAARAYVAAADADPKRIPMDVRREMVLAVLIDHSAVSASPAATYPPGATPAEHNTYGVKIDGWSEASE